MVTPTWLKASSTNSRTLCISPVAITKSSGFSTCSISHIACVGEIENGTCSLVCNKQYFKHVHYLNVRMKHLCFLSRSRSLKKGEKTIVQQHNGYFYNTIIYVILVLTIYIDIEISSKPIIHVDHMFLSLKFKK